MSGKWRRRVDNPTWAWLPGVPHHMSPQCGVKGGRTSPADGPHDHARLGGSCGDRSLPLLLHGSKLRSREGSTRGIRGASVIFRVSSCRRWGLPFSASILSVLQCLCVCVSRSCTGSEASIFTSLSGLACPVASDPRGLACATAADSPRRVPASCFPTFCFQQASCLAPPYRACPGCEEPLNWLTRPPPGFPFPPSWIPPQT